MKPIASAIDESAVAVFKKWLAKLSQYKGRGTEMISLYVPEAADRSSVMNQLNEEISQASNIKSPSTRKNVQGALRKIIGFLKHIDFKIPQNGLVVFAGNTSEQEGKSDVRLFTVRPISKLTTRLYWCDSEFHLAPLKEMMQPSDIYGMVAIDKSEATIAVLSGKKYDIISRHTSAVAGKTRAGGQSSLRFERLREEAAQEFYKRISERVNEVFLPKEGKLKGIIIGGPGMTKNYFVNKDLIDYRLKKKIIAMIDIAYTDESGIREIVQKSEDVLHDTDLMRERVIVNKFLEEVAKDGLAMYGQKEIEEALAEGKVSVLLVSEALDWVVIKRHCEACNADEEIILKETKKEPEARCGKCGSQHAEIVEEIDYLDYLLEKTQRISAGFRVISTDTQEGEQFYKAFGGMGALLRYK